MGGMSELPTWARDALAGVYDPCCREKGISVLDMGLVRSVQVEDGVARVELLLTSGWCPFAAGVLTEVKEQILRAPGISDADVAIVWDEAWTTDRLSPRPPDIRKMVYEESDTDMLVAMPLPLTDLFSDGLSPWEACADLAGRDPDRTVFWGSVNPLEGRKALDLMERQVGEFNARAFKFYN